MRVHLTRKLAESVDGVDLSTHREGDTFDLPTRQAELLIAEQWATPVVRRTAEARGASVSLPSAEAADMVNEAHPTRRQLRRRTKRR